MNYHFDLSEEDGKRAFIENVNKRSRYRKKAQVIKNDIEKLKIALEENEQKYKAHLKDLKITVRARKKAALQKMVDECDETKKCLIRDIAQKNLLLKQEEFEVYGETGETPVYFGSYPQDKEGGIKPIEWHVLESDGKEAVLISRYILDYAYFHHEDKDVHWAESDIRRFLNEDFYHSTFSKHEKAYICETRKATSENKAYHTEAGPDTIDRVYLLSYNETLNYYAYDSGRMAYATQYAIERGVAEIEETGASYWWLRSNGGNLYNACVINFKGYPFLYGFYVSSARYGIRPVITIDLTV